jgi:hypothetical protein
MPNVTVCVDDDRQPIVQLYIVSKYSLETSNEQSNSFIKQTITLVFDAIAAKCNTLKPIIVVNSSIDFGLFFANKRTQSTAEIEV